MVRSAAPGAGSNPAVRSNADLVEVGRHAIAKCALFFEYVLSFTAKGNFQCRIAAGPTPAGTIKGTISNLFAVCKTPGHRFEPCSVF